MANAIYALVAFSWVATVFTERYRLPLIEPHEWRTSYKSSRCSTRIPEFLNGEAGLTPMTECTTSCDVQCSHPSNTWTGVTLTQISDWSEKCGARAELKQKWAGTRLRYKCEVQFSEAVLNGLPKKQKAYYAAKNLAAHKENIEQWLQTAGKGSWPGCYCSCSFAASHLFYNKGQAIKPFGKGTGQGITHYAMKWDSDYCQEPRDNCFVTSTLTKLNGEVKSKPDVSRSLQQYLSDTMELSVDAARKGQKKPYCNWEGMLNGLSTREISKAKGMSPYEEVKRALERLGVEEKY